MHPSLARSVTDFCIKGWKVFLTEELSRTINDVRPQGIRELETASLPSPRSGRGVGGEGFFKADRGFRADVSSQPRVSSRNDLGRSGT